MKDKLDLKTRLLLEELQKSYKIKFEEKQIDYCELFIKSNDATIYFNPNDIDTETITHELLHIWLEKFNYTVGNYIYMVNLEHEKLNKVFSKFLCNYIENCFDHHKMFPKYSEMGYSPEKFLKNGLAEKCSIQDINSLNLKFSEVYDSTAINKFIGFLISIYADHIKENKYTEHLFLLKQKDSDLFKIVTDFWNSWVDFDITKINAITNSDIQLNEKFITEMEMWVNDKVLY